MTTVTLDTHELVKQLITSYNFSEEQAEGVVHAVNSIDLSSLATKADIEDIKREIEGVRKEIGDAKSELLEVDPEKWTGS